MWTQGSGAMTSRKPMTQNRKHKGKKKTTCLLVKRLAENWTRENPTMSNFFMLTWLFPRPLDSALSCKKMREDKKMCRHHQVNRTNHGMEEDCGTVNWQFIIRSIALTGMREGVYEKARRAADTTWPFFKIGQTSPLMVIQSLTTWTNQRTANSHIRIQHIEGGEQEVVGPGSRTRRNRAQGEFSNQIKNKEMANQREKKASKRATHQAYLGIWPSSSEHQSPRVRIHVSGGHLLTVPDSPNFLPWCCTLTQEQTGSPGTQADIGYYLWPQAETYLAKDSCHPFPHLSLIPSHDDVGTRLMMTH